MFPSRLLRIAGLLVLIPLALRSASAQGDDEQAHRALRAARALALQGKADSALVLYAGARVFAEKAGDNAMVATALEGSADVYAVYKPCSDSALLLLHDAVSRAAPGERSAADALVRMLASRGNVAEAQRVLSAAYGSVESLGRSITRESMQWLQGTAAIQVASAREAGALSSLTSALQIATRLGNGDVTDSVSTGKEEVTPLNFWLVYDLAHLRLNAKAPSIANKATGTRLMSTLVNAGINFDEQDERIVPVSRLADRLALRALECEKNGTRCPAPPPSRCPPR